MSLSRPRKDENQPQEKYWIGYDVEPPKLRKQSKYSLDMLTIALPVAEIEEADGHYQRWDLDEPEHYNYKGRT